MIVIRNGCNCQFSFCLLTLSQRSALAYSLITYITSQFTVNTFLGVGLWPVAVRACDDDTLMDAKCRFNGEVNLSSRWSGQLGRWEWLTVWPADVAWKNKRNAKKKN